jgi:hypothetical protein
VPGFNPFTVFDTAVLLVPEPALEDDVVLPYEVVVPYSNR